MRIGAITFHGSHNYGSVLQAYALQTYVERLCEKQNVRCEYEIINYRSRVQKNLYAPPNGKTTKDRLKRLLRLRYRNSLDQQSSKFEQFISDYLHTGLEFSDSKALNSLTQKYDVLLAGSDQIWNVRAKDFSYAYLFEGCTKKKVSYATSLGPLEIEWEEQKRSHFLSNLLQFSSISVREELSRQVLYGLIPNTPVAIHVDPSLLIDASIWRSIQSDMGSSLGDYILFYSLEPNCKQINMVKKLSKQTGLPVVVTKYRNKYDYCNPFIKKYDTGPLDFLSLVDHARIVITSSFHGTAFSLNYGRPLIVMDGLKDARIRSLLKSTGTEGCSYSSETSVSGIQGYTNDISTWLNRERVRSSEYLAKELFR